MGGKILWCKRKITYFGCDLTYKHWDKQHGANISRSLCSSGINKKNKEIKKEESQSLVKSSRFLPVLSSAMKSWCSVLLSATLHSHLSWTLSLICQRQQHRFQWTLGYIQIHYKSSSNFNSASQHRINQSAAPSHRWMSLTSWSKGCCRWSNITDKPEAFLIEFYYLCDKCVQRL